MVTHEETHAVIDLHKMDTGASKIALQSFIQSARTLRKKASAHPRRSNKSQVYLLKLIQLQDHGTSCGASSGEDPRGDQRQADTFMGIGLSRTAPIFSDESSF